MGNLIMNSIFTVYPINVTNYPWFLKIFGIKDQYNDNIGLILPYCKRIGEKNYKHFIKLYHINLYFNNGVHSMSSYTRGDYHLRFYKNEYISPFKYYYKEFNNEKT